jgi:hypothetical protein
MTTKTYPIVNLDERDLQYIRRHLTKKGSDFHRMLGWLVSGGGYSADELMIATVRDRGRIVGWARTEKWTDHESGIRWDTLESFVDEDYRSRGVSRLAATALGVDFLYEESACSVAVFHPHMLMVARAAGYHPTLFVREGQSWRQS